MCILCDNYLLFSCVISLRGLNITKLVCGFQITIEIYIYFTDTIVLGIHTYYFNNFSKHKNLLFIKLNFVFNIYLVNPRLE